MLESMKMESSLTAPRAGQVRHVLVGPNTQVGARAPLVQIDEPDDAGPDGGERVLFESTGEEFPEAPERCQENLRRLEWLVLGYDVTDADVKRIIADLHGACSDLVVQPRAHPRRAPAAAAVRGCSRAHAAATRGGPRAELLRSPQEYLHAFLRSLDAEAEGLPERFVALLERALAHYGIAALDRTPALEEAFYRLALSQQRVAVAARSDDGNPRPPPGARRRSRRQRAR